jgi:hypothetical protein
LAPGEAVGFPAGDLTAVAFLVGGAFEAVKDVDDVGEAGGFGGLGGGDAADAAAAEE